MAKIQAFHRRLYRPTNGRTALDASFFSGDERWGGGRLWACAGTWCPKSEWNFLRDTKCGHFRPQLQGRLPDWSLNCEILEQFWAKQRSLLAFLDAISYHFSLNFALFFQTTLWKTIPAMMNHPQGWEKRTPRTDSRRHSVASTEKNRQKITIIQYISFNLATSKCKAQGRSILARLHAYFLCDFTNSDWPANLFSCLHSITTTHLQRS